MPKILLTNRAWIPESEVDEEKVEKRFSAPMFDDMTCSSCYWRTQRPCQACQVCPAFKGWLHLWKKKTVKGEHYIGIPLANWRASLDALKVPEDLDIEDFRPDIPMKTGLKFTGKLYNKIDNPDRADQETVVDDFMTNSEKRDYCGVIQAAPRSGKSNMGLFIAIEELNKRTLITGAQIEWLEQFCEYAGDMTNLKSLAAKGKTPVVLISNKPSSRKLEAIGVKVVKSWEQVPDDCDIVLSTYLTIKHKPGEDRTKLPFVLREYIMGKFTTLIVDEAHQTAALVFSQFGNNIDVTHRIFLTATPDRKDGTSFIVYKLGGPVSAISDTPVMVPEFKLLETGISRPPETIKGPSAYETWLAYNEERNKIIIRNVFNDLQAHSKHCILLVVRRLKHATDLARMINQTAAYKNQNEGTKYAMPLADVFTSSKGDRSQALADAKSGKVRVIIAIEKIVKHGLSVPAWTHIYTNIAPISNGPGFYQLYSRVSTPYEGKPQPVVRHLLDATSASVKTLKRLYEDEPDSVRNALRGDEPKLKMEKADFNRMLGIFGKGPFAYFGPGKDDQLNRRRAPRVIGGFSSKRSKDSR